MQIESTSGETEKSLAQKFYLPTINSSKRNRSEWVVHLRKTYKELQSKPLPSTFKPRLEGPSVDWKVFKRLSLAISYAGSCTKDCMVFSHEERTPENSGQRLFLVAHPQHMWLNYKLRPPVCRCSYEIIRENFPCKLYFDLEFNKTQNPTKDGNELTKIFIKCVIAVMLELYNIHLQIQNFLWLDSSTEEKFSSHLILQISNIAFQNNIVAGSFVSSLLSDIMSRITNNTNSDELWPSSEDLKSLFVQKADGKCIFFCDSGVYTKNRNFRLYLSTKYGKRAPFLISKHNQYVPVDTSSYEDINELIFYDSLITFFRKNTESMRLLSDVQNNVQEVVPKLSPSLNCRKENIGFTQSGPSPFSEIDTFILSLVKDLTTTGFIRRWSYLEKEEILIYEIGNYRFCSNIGRHHKSNNIMLIVDLKRKHYYQKCYDPECRLQNYKSDVKPLPPTLYSLPAEFFDDDCFSQLDVQQKDANLNDGLCSENEYDMVVDESFFDELCPFTQLSRPSENQKVSNEDMLQTQDQQLENSDEIRDLLEDKYFDGISTSEIECKNTEKMFGNENNSDGVAIACDGGYEYAICKQVKKCSPDYMSKEDELMMAEAAEVLECSFEDADMFLEETIF